MAKFISALGSFSGKMGAIVFSHNRAGTYVKRFTIPVNPKTISQINVRFFFSSVTKAWSAVTSGNKLAWQTLATGLGLPYGKGLYQSRNQNLSLALQTVATNATITNTPPDPIPFDNDPMPGAATATTMTIDLSGFFPGDLVPTDQSIVVTAEVAKNGAISTSARPKQIMFVGLAGADLSTAFNIFTTYVNAFGTPLVGDGIRYEIYPIQNVTGVKGGTSAFQQKFVA